MLPADLNISHAAAIAFIFAAWGLYTPILKMVGKGSLNAQLHVVRLRWMQNLKRSARENRVLDTILLGHISSSVSFFGSATLLVLATLIGTLLNSRALHVVALQHKFLGTMSVEVFSLNLAVVTTILAGCFFSFVYALRKLAYTFALIGALPDKGGDEAASAVMVEQTATVLTEAVKSLNNGIRGYYFAIASLFLFAGPAVCTIVTFLMSGLLYYRQLHSKTALAIGRYVEAEALLMDDRPGA